MKSFREPFYAFICRLQDEICQALEKEDGKARFREDVWARPEGGGGKSRIISHGNVFESGGVNISAVWGNLPESMQHYLGTARQQFYACGLSLVLHPIHPMVPTVHANYRYFELYDDSGQVVDQWFGGGSDLTPCYLFREDAIHFHQTLKNACDPYGYGLYPAYKKACDNYFYNHHRKEARGIGGIFFDRLRGDAEHSAEFWFDFVRSAGSVFVDSYLPLVAKRKIQGYTSEHKHWQEIRRGRYVEFNLLHDKGTLFGLKTNGRIESILMSLPGTVRWEYDYPVREGSDEERMMRVLVDPVDWV